MVVTADVGSIMGASVAFPNVKGLPVEKDLPDAMTMNAGSRISTGEQWRQPREEFHQSEQKS